MEGKRFGVGLAAGLLVALAVVTTAGGFGSNPASVLLAPSSNSGAMTKVITSSVTSTVTVAETTTAASTATYSASSSGGNTGGFLWQNATSYPASTTTSSSSTVSSKITSTNSSNPTSQAADNAAASQGTPKYSSRIDSLATQPLLSNAVILVPVLVAFLLGAFLYRISVRERAAAVEE